MATKLVKTPARKPQRLKKTPIPETLIYEMNAEKAIYYRDYQQVMLKKKTEEEIMGSSALQAQLVALLVGMLVSRLDLQKYVVMTNGLGFIHLPKSWRVLDIAVFERKKVKKELLSTKYVNTAPNIVIEVDTKADLSSYENFFSYVTEKTDQLLDAGVEKVIWIFTESKNVLLAEPDKQWSIARWSDSIPVLDDIEFQLDQLMNTLVAGTE